jgi:hypothetical protein
VLVTVGITKPRPRPPARGPFHRDDSQIQAEAPGRDLRLTSANGVPAFEGTTRIAKRFIVGTNELARDLHDSPSSRSV